MRPYFLLIVMLLISPAWATASQPTAPDWKSLEVLDLPTARQITLASNPSLDAAAMRVAQARERVKQATASFWPWLDLSGGVSHVDMSDNDHASALAQARIFNPLATVSDPEDYNSAKLSISWLIFDGLEREFSRKAARIGSIALIHAEMEVQRQLLFAVAGAYHNAMSAREDILIAEADAAFNQRLMEEAKVRYNLGAGSLSDVLNFQIAVHAASTQLLNGQRGYEIAMTGLGALLGIEDPSFATQVTIAPLGEEYDQDMAPPDIAHWAHVAKTQRPDVLQASAAVDQADAAIKIARAKFFPTVALSAALDASRTHDAGFESEDVEQTVAATVKYNLFAGGLHRAQMAEAKIALREAKASLRQATLSALSEVNEAVAKVRYAQEQLTLQKQTVVLVQQNRDLVEKEYQAGQTSLVRLKEAQRDLIQVQGNLARSRVLLRQAWQELFARAAQNQV